MIESFEPYINYSWTLLLHDHGAVALSNNVSDAFYKMERLEHTAKIVFLARLLGGEKELNIEKIQELLSISQTAYSLN